MNNLPSLYQQFIHLSRYSRWIPSQGRRETWEETVDRYFSFFEKHLQSRCDYTLDAGTKNELRAAILSLGVMPSMRCLMTAGPALERDEVAGYNCLGRNTLVTTKNGYLPIHKLVGKQELLDINGEWVKAEVKSFGEQELHKVVFQMNSRKIEIEATLNHDWVLSDGRRVKTKDLRRGDVIPYVTAKRNVDCASIDYRLGVIHGLVYGDGTAVKYKKTPQDKICISQERIKGYVIRLCSDQEDLLPYFANYTRSSIEGDPLIFLYDNFAKTHKLKELPENESDDYLVGFFRGWLAADGYVPAKKYGHMPSLCCGEEEMSWLRTNLMHLGYLFPRHVKLKGVTNFGKRKKESYSVSIDRQCLTSDDFLIRRKKDQFSASSLIGYSYSYTEATNKVEEVFCAVVPNTHTFVLANGIVTGNCSFIAIDNPRSFDEILYILSCGTGVGFSVERQYVTLLPTVAESFYESDTTIVVQDSRIGWARALKELIGLLYQGQIPKYDVTRVRPSGAPLKTFGGRASGPEPLVALFDFCIKTFRNAAGRKLQSIECHDIVCKIAEVIVVGGVRRSALISLSNLSDDRMRAAKSGQWWIENVQRALANNSACYTEKPDIGIFMDEWKSLYESRSGERGIFNVAAARKCAESLGENSEGKPRRDASKVAGTNPCAEILLRNKGFCNLSEVVVKPDDTKETLLKKVEFATILGTFQSTLTEFRYLTKEWKKNAEEERLLGVSLTGILDNEFLSTPSDELKEFLLELREKAIEVNRKWAKLLGIPESASITCVKPSGTVSQLVDSASGIHARHSPYYIRTVRSDNKDPLCIMMKAMGFPHEADVTKPDHTTVFSFPVRSPENAIFRDELTAIQHLELWLFYKKYWAEHTVSITVSVKEHEWLDVAAYVYKHFDHISGISFLPFSDHVYKQAPYQDCTREQYLSLLSKMPVDVDWSKLHIYEKEDTTTSTRELACSAGSCEMT